MNATWKNNIVFSLLVMMGVLLPFIVVPATEAFTIAPRITSVTPRFGTSNTPIVVKGDGMRADKEMVLVIAGGAGEASIQGNKKSASNGSFTLTFKMEAQYGVNTIKVQEKDHPEYFAEDLTGFTMRSAGALIQGAVDDATNLADGSIVDVTGTGPSGSSNDWVVFHGTGFLQGGVSLELADIGLAGVGVSADAKGSFYAAFQLKDVMTPAPSGGNKTLKAIGGIGEASVNFFVEPRITNVQVDDGFGYADITDTDHPEDNGRRLGDRKRRDVFVAQKVRVMGDGFTASKKASVTIGSKAIEFDIAGDGTIIADFEMDAQAFGEKAVSAVDRDSNKGSAWGGVKPRVIGRIASLRKIRGDNDDQKKTLTDVRVDETLELGLDGFQANQTITVKVGRADNFDVVSTPVIESGNRTGSNGATTLKFKMPKRYSRFRNGNIVSWAVRVDGGKDENKELRSDNSFDAITGGTEGTDGLMRLDSIITKVDPSAGYAGTRVKIEGSGFGYIRPIKVYFHTIGGGVIPGGDGTELDPGNTYPPPGSINPDVGYAETESLSNGFFSAYLFLPVRTTFGRTQITVVDVNPTDVASPNIIEKRVNYTSFVYSDPTAGGRIALEPDHGEVTKEVTVVGSGYPASRDVGNLTFDGGVVTVSDAGAGTVSGNRIRTDSGGAFVVKFNVPDIKRGNHDVKTSVVAPYEKGTFTVESKIWVSPGEGTIGTTVAVYGRGLPASTNIGRLMFGGLIDLENIDLRVSGVEGTLEPADRDLGGDPFNDVHKHDIVTTSAGRFVVRFKTPSNTLASSYDKKPVTVEGPNDGSLVLDHVAEFKNLPSISVISNDIPGRPTEGRPGDTTFTITGAGYPDGHGVTIKGITAAVTGGDFTDVNGVFTITATLSDQQYGGKTIKVVDPSHGSLDEEGEVPGATFTIRGKVELAQLSGNVGDKFNVTVRGFGDENVDIYIGDTLLVTADADGNGYAVKEVELKEHPGGAVFIRGVGQSTHEEALANFTLHGSITTVWGGGGVKDDVDVVYGEGIKVEGKGFGANESVRITFGSKVNITTTITNENGSFSTIFSADSQVYGPKTIRASSATTSAEKLKVLTMHPKITVSPITVEKDTVITVQAWGFKDVDDLVIQFDGSDKKTGIAANSKGEFNAGSEYFQTPDSTNGEKTIRVYHASDPAVEATATVIFSKIDGIVLQTDKDGQNVKIGDAITVTGAGYPLSTSIGTLMLDSTADGGLSPRVLPVTDAGAGSVSGSVYIRTDEKGAFKVTFTMASGQDAEGGNRDNKMVFINNYPQKQSAPFEVVPSFFLSADEGPVGMSLTATGHGYIAEDTEIHLDFETSTPGTYKEVAKFKTSNGSFTKTFNVPGFAFGSHDVKIREEGPSKTFKILPSLSIEPTSGGVGTPVTVTGKGFIGSTDVSINFGDTKPIIIVPAQIVNSNGQFVASFNVDVQGAGSKDVMAVQAGISEYDIKKHAEVSFTIGAGITSVDPKEGSKGDTVWVRGSGFPKDGNVTIQFGTSTVATVKAKSNGDFEGSFTVPPQPSGDVTITARSGSVSATANFIMKPKAERSPEKGKMGTNVSVTGWGFHPGSATVTFGGEQVATGSVNSTGTITASFVVGSPDPVPFASYDVKITDAQNASASGGNFQVLPSITVSKTSVVIGETITINGKGFEAGEEIWIHFEGQSGENVPITNEVFSDGTFGGAEATVPSLSEGAHQLYVWGSRSAGLFIIGVPGVADDYRPHVTLTVKPGFSISPLQGVVGSTVKVSGSGFEANAVVVVEVDGEVVSTGSTDALGNFKDITFTVPEKPYGVVAIKVTVGTTVRMQAFTIKPNITNVYPTQASLNDSVEVNGTGFGASEPLQVTLGTVVAPILSGGVTTYKGAFYTTFRIPNGLTSTEPLAVTVRGARTGATATSSDKITLTGGLISVIPTRGAVKTPVKVFGTHPASIANAVVGTLTFGGQTITVANDSLTIINGVGSLVGDEIRTDGNGYYHVQFLVPIVPTGEYYLSIGGDSFLFTVVTRLTGPGSVHIGDAVSLTGLGFIPGEVAQVTLDTLTPQTATADENGSFTVTFPALPIRPGGVLQAWATGDQGSEATTTVTLAARLTELYVGTPDVTEAYVGDTVTVEGDGFAASTAATITVDGTDAVILSGGTTDSDGVLSLTTFRVPDVPCGPKTVTVVTGVQTALGEITVLCHGDISGDGNITAHDASLALQYIVGLIPLSPGQREAADVTGDGNVTALDAALILQYSVGLITEFPKGQPSIAPALHPKSKDKLLMEAIEQLGIASLNNEQKQVLDQLKQLVSERMIPAHTALFPNYPNPFNPETWIPYHLAQDSKVTIRIYSIKGELIRTINLGTKNAGVYTSKNKAAYWNGRTQTGEGAASGIYYYTIQTSNFTATRKMILVK